MVGGMSSGVGGMSGGGKHIYITYVCPSNINTWQHQSHFRGGETATIGS